MVARLCVYKNSIGSSMVRMWQVRCSLMQSRRAASIDDFPAPRAPVTSTMRSPSFATSPRCAGSPSQAKSGIVPGMTLITTAQLPRCRNTFTRKRATPGRPKETSHEPCSCSMVIARLFCPIRSEAKRLVSSALSTSSPGARTATSCPDTSICGGRPGEKISWLI